MEGLTVSTETATGPGTDEGRRQYWQSYWSAHAAASLDASTQAQVQRTWQGSPIEEERFALIVDWVLTNLSPGPGDAVLDLCCGNGAITHFLAERSDTVLGVDFADDLLRHVDRVRYPNIALQRNDIRDCVFEENSFDRILLYAGLQYLSQGETVTLMRDLRRWLRPGGRVLLGDVPDADRMWDFFNTEQRRAAYFDQLVTGAPIIGTWFAPSWLAHLGRDAGFAQAQVLYQPEALPFRHFRFELLLG